jgi:flagellar hook-associated protein 2
MSSLSSLGGSSAALSSLTPTGGSGSSSGGSSGLLSVGGLITGLNTNQIIQAELSLQQVQIDTVTAHEAAAQQQEAAYKALQAQLLNFQASVAQLAQPSNGPFDGRTATSSDTSAVTAAASSSAAAGIYSLTVNSLAQANEVASQGFASATSPISQGTLTVSSGGSTANVVINGGNDTLQGLAAAINSAGAGVTATVINTGTVGQPYRLLLTASQTGTANAITVSGSFSGGGVPPQFTQNAVGAVAAAATNQGTATATSGGTYTGTKNKTYAFTVTGGGTVGGNSAITFSYTDSTDNSGPHTITLAAGTNSLTTADGVTLTFGTNGTLQAGDQFTVSATVPTVQAAADASVTIGSGAGALTVSSPTNTVSTAINGVTLNLLATTAQPVQVTVANDTSTAQTAVQNFVTAYNSVISTIADDVRYDPSTKSAGVLLGDPSVVNIEDQLRSLVTDPVAGANPKLNNLAALGITSDASGQLQLNTGTLNKVLSGQVSGVSLDDVRSLFASGGRSTNPAVTFVNATAATKASATPYGVEVTQAAQQATLTAGTALGANPQVTSGNNTFTLTVNGVTSGTITVPPSSNYTPQTLVQAVQAQVNADGKVGNENVTVGLNGSNQLTFTSGSYGSSSSLAVGSAAFLGFTSPARATGRDVAGSFLVNGTPEPATGSGQLLTGDAGNANTAGLAVNVTLQPWQVGSAPQASLTVTRGVAAQLGGALNTLLDPTTGQLQTIDQNFQDQIAAYQKQIDLLQQEYNQRQAQLAQQFANLESAVNNLKTASGFLTAQTTALLSLNGTSSSSSRTGG